MALFQDSGADPRQRFAEILAFYGTLGDAASGHPRGFGQSATAAALALAAFAGLDEATSNALAFAGVLCNVGAIAGDCDPWDVPISSARICEELLALPAKTTELVRAHAERWDGTGFPDQLRWEAIPFAAQLLMLGDMLAAAGDGDAALERINIESGRSLSPRVASLYADWLRRGESIPPFVLPWHALDPPACDVDALLACIPAST